MSHDADCVGREMDKGICDGRLAPDCGLDWICGAECVAVCVGLAFDVHEICDFWFAGTDRVRYSFALGGTIFNRISACSIDHQVFDVYGSNV